MTESITNLINQIENNTLLVTLLSGGLIVSLFVYARDIISKLWNMILALISFKIVNKYNVEHCQPDQLRKLLFVINNKSKVLWLKEVELVEALHNENNTITTIPHGISYRILYGTLVIVDKSFDTEGTKMVTNVIIRVFFQSKNKFIKRFLSDIIDVKLVSNENQLILDYVGEYDYSHTIIKNKRPAKSIYCSNDAMNTLISDAKYFIANKQYYLDCNIPYKRNYLLYGKPGTGKTSSALSLASELGWNICSIDIHVAKINNIVFVMSNKRNTIFLFEDIDALSKNFNERKDKDDIDDCELTLAQLLNLTDGLLTPEGNICIFTTNHINVLDEAFLRDGRMDKKIEFVNFDAATSNKIIKDKLGFTVDNIKDDICPASLQESILQAKLTNRSKKDFENEWRA